MNIISNDCLSGHLYTLMGRVFNHPLFYCTIEVDDYLQFLENFETIDFNNYKISLFGEKNNKVKVNFDNIFNAYFIHHYKDNKYDKPTVVKEIDGIGNIANNVRYKDIEKYVEDKIIERNKKLNKKDNTTFIISERKLNLIAKVNKEQFIDIINVFNKHYNNDNTRKLLIITESYYNDLKDYNTNNIDVVKIKETSVIKEKAKLIIDLKHKFLI